MRKVLFLFLMIISFRPAYCQDELKPGFKLLETGKFAEGAAFFKAYLEKYDSTNRTALLCYGRGIGLSGNVTEAKQVFDRLLQRFPGDFEISLNAAEALMWGKEYSEAKTYYEKLLKENPNSFPANLGYANAMASLHEYGKALEYVNKSLVLQPGNENAMVSRKYTRLGLADQYSRKQQYADAAPLLNDILSDYPGDVDALLAKAQLAVMTKDYSRSDSIYQVLLHRGIKKNDVYLHLSYLTFLKKRNTLALSYADSAIACTEMGTEKYLMARLGRVSALGWNKKFKQAFNELDSLNIIFPDNNYVLLKKAGLTTMNGDYGNAVRLFKASLAVVPGSFDGNLGNADAYFAQELDVNSQQAVLKTLEYFPDQKDANDFLKKLRLRHAPSFISQDFRSSDKGGNVAYNYMFRLEWDIVPSFRMNVAYAMRDAKNTIENNKGKNQNYSIGFRWRIFPFWLMNGNVGIASLNGDTASKNHLLIDWINEFKLDKHQVLQVRYQRDVQNFTAGLINNNLTFDNYNLTYNMATSFKLGLFSQYYYSKYSDGNSRNLLFASLYYDLTAAPVIKFGLNFSTMKFKEQVPKIYFSPSAFKSYELFGQVENLQVPDQKLLYQFVGAAGYQFIEQNGAQITYRVSTSLGYRPVKNFEILAYYMLSNSATSSVAGYKYTETGIKLKWIIL
jgi:tetratricopeptide (TPR) repeat protein